MWVEEVYEYNPKGSIQNEKSPMKCYIEQNHYKTITAWLMKAKKKKSPNMKHSYHKGALQKPLWRILIEEGLAKSSKKTAHGEHRQVASL